MHTIEYRDWDGSIRTHGAYADENDAIDAAAAHYAATGNRAVAIVAAPTEPEEFAIECTLHRYGDADAPPSEAATIGHRPTFCAICGMRSEYFAWLEPYGWVCDEGIVASLPR